MKKGGGGEMKLKMARVIQDDEQLWQGCNAGRHTLKFGGFGL